MVETEHHLGFYKSQLSFEYVIAFEGTVDKCELLHNHLALSYPTQLNFLKLFHKYAVCLIKRNASLRRFFMNIAKK